MLSTSRIQGKSHSHEANANDPWGFSPRCFADSLYVCPLATMSLPLAGVRLYVIVTGSGANSSYQASRKRGWNETEEEPAVRGSHLLSLSGNALCPSEVQTHWFLHTTELLLVKAVSPRLSSCLPTPTTSADRCCDGGRCVVALGNAPPVASAGYIAQRASRLLPADP
jgi:hypothetical protein